MHENVCISYSHVRGKNRVEKKESETEKESHNKPTRVHRDC